ncbi:MAG: GNAT family N-acetyltransferase, partial [Acidimicrobiia bacterium]|nr:GNAT family N-acetyltransferase [Acidimicrobiia bacterium]
FESVAGIVSLDVAGDLVTFTGPSDLTDYHSPLGSDPAALMESVVAVLDSRCRFDLDSLPIEAAEPLAKGLNCAGVAVEIVPHTVAAVLDLPASFDEYLALIGKKQRHELRRKRRRYEELVGEPVFESHHGEGWAFDEFVRLHRMSGGGKGRFMDAEHEAFFRALVHQAGWRIDLLRIPGTDSAAACLFVFADSEGMYLYNSAYDPALADASPGMAMLGAAIEAGINSGSPRFDFLKGDEIYKFRLGAVERALYRVVST